MPVKLSSISILSLPISLLSWHLAKYLKSWPTIWFKHLRLVLRSSIVSDINIEVTYALPEKQFLLSVKVAEGTTIEDAIIASGILALRSDIDLKKNKVGIYSRPAKLGDVVQEGDRIEIYRPLIADPKELRRKRAEKSKENNK